MNKKYVIEINGRQIGCTAFEFADAPMGVVYDKIIFYQIESPYEFFRNHCKTYNVSINLDDPKERMIDTVVIPQLKVFKENGQELNGWGGAVTGMDSDEFEIQFGGVTSELMQTEFENHYKDYWGNQ